MFHTICCTQVFHVACVLCCSKSQGCGDLWWRGTGARNGAWRARADGRGAWRASVLRTGHDGSGANGLESSLTWRAGRARRVIWIPRGGGHVRARKKLQTGQAARACGLACGLVSASIAADLANRSTDGTLETQSTLLSTAVEPQSTIHTHIKHLKFESTALMSQ
jgi:hypothetical protein